MHRRRQAGVTLIEMLLVVTIIGVMIGVAFPSITAGLDSIRLRTASDSIASTLNSALARADRKLLAMEVRVLKAENMIVVAGAEPGYYREVAMPSGVTIERVLPLIPELDENLPRQFLVHPGGTVPRIAIELKNRRNNRRLVSVDPITGVVQAENVP